MDMVYPDHYEFNHGNRRILEEKIINNKIDVFIVTAKDKNRFRFLQDKVKILTLEVEMVIEDETGFFKLVEAVIK